MSHFISLEKARHMTKEYRDKKESLLAKEYHGKNILALSETFERSAFDALLSQPDCVKLRIYYGLDDTAKVHAIVVGVNSKDEDILPSESSEPAISTESSTSGFIVEEGTRCPDICPTPSSLSGG